MPMSEHRDIEPAPGPEGATGRSARNVIAVIGIDRYQHQSWRPLTNAVSDARGAAELFVKLGFEQVAALYNDQATSEAIEGLVTDDLTRLGAEDSLVLFYAGHGSTRSHQLGDEVVKTGYIVPFDASDRTATRIDLDGWLRAVALLPAKHILVILDACHSGIALDPVSKWRDGGAPPELPLSALRARRSRRIITSALDNELALDSGPRHGHSLFTGCLLEALTHGVGRPGRRVITTSELGLYLQARVEEYPGSRQTPDFGAFDFDDRGEMVFPFVMAPEVPEAPEPDPPPRDKDDAQVIDGANQQHRRRPRWRAFVDHVGAALAVLLALFANHTLRQQTGPRLAVASSTVPDGAAQGGCPEGMVRVPAATFQMGSPDGEGRTNENPQHEVTLSAYCIDRTEVTVGEYRACVAAGGCSAIPAKMPLLVNYTRGEMKSLLCNGADRLEHPINCVSVNQAAAYCQWVDKRLPTEAEWEYAARGGDGRKYPWGNQPPDADRLNACGKECVVMADRELKVDWQGMYNEDDGWPTTAPVGRYPAGASPFGALDMAGNVYEWTADPFRRYTKAAETNPRYPQDNSNGVYRGGSWISSYASLVRAVSRDYFIPQRGYVDVGFRCARWD